MKLPTCVGCERPVLELQGQFEVFDSFYLEPGGPDPDSSGTWHLACVVESSHGQAWSTARVRNHVEVRRNELVAEVDGWTVVRNPRTRETLAFGRTGESLELRFGSGRPRRVAGGAIHAVDEEYNLELDDRDAIKVIQDALTTVGTFPLLSLAEVLGISERVVHPEALEGGLFRFDRALRGDWGPDFVAARAAYGVFVPDALEPYVVRGR